MPPLTLMFKSARPKGSRHRSPANLPRSGLSVLYFVGVVGGGRIKIGITTNLGVRLSALRSTSPVDLELLLWVPGGRAEERYVHEELRAHRTHGEWFDPDPEVLRALEDLRAEESQRLAEASR